MKRLKTIMSALVLLTAFACSKTHQTGSGQVSFAVSSDQSVVDRTKSNVSDYTALPSSTDFSIDITDASAVSVWSGKLSEWDATASLKAGNYTVTATYGDLETEGFDKPYFTGSTDFTVKGDESTTVSIPVSLGNTIVLVSCTDNFNNYYPDYTFKITRNGSDVLTFVKGEDKAGFVDGYKFTLEGQLTGLSGAQTFSKEYTDLDAATAYTFIFDAANVGGASITVKFNNTVETIELGDYELND